MAAKRVPAKLTWEQHQDYATKLRGLWTFLQERAMDRKDRSLRAWLSHYLIELQYEMDELVFIDCQDRPKNDRLDVYYRWELLPDISRYGYSQTAADLLELREALLPTNPKGGAVKCLDAMLARLRKAGV